MKAVAVLLASFVAAIAMAGCGPRDPVPSADSHQPENPGSYETGAQETRDGDEARAADSPNDDGRNEGRDGNDPQRELPSRTPP